MRVVRGARSDGLRARLNTRGEVWRFQGFEPPGGYAGSPSEGRIGPPTGPALELIREQLALEPLHRLWGGGLPFTDPPLGRELGLTQ